MAMASEPERSFTPQNLALAEDVEAPGNWRVEYFDDDGAGYMTIFAGQETESRARDYFEATQRGGSITELQTGWKAARSRSRCRRTSRPTPSRLRSLHGSEAGWPWSIATPAG
jgi:hypothetical protein